ncbi:hypothetical protein BCR33DRAFT_717558 [Rhizoclosmatium globosum]|uniref:Uncharacterized protein n=1 Tax=Rhizoclosmatium globosum TaxID=329046 RepID=A0A1Y2C8G8_9FUNG|nr:hypothetical protein BCR33DRAFT_717558 [Rhizoclosmatium globosum]|eukprot:ORY43330.1 hypothetical protein BCR33DRAFT_717558 [Rhizoclosmatium globosum]
MVRSVCAGGYLETLKVLMEDERVLGRREELIVECLMELSRSAIRHDILAYLQSLKAEEKSEHRVEQVETSLKVVRTFSTNQFPISLLFTSLIAIFVLI